MKTFASLFLLVLFSLPSYAIDLTLYEGEAYWDKVDALDWKEGPLTINHTNQGKVKLKKGEVALINDDAKQIMYWINGVQFTSTLFITTDYGSYTDYRYVNEGYVKLDDWEDVNADKFIKQLRDDSKESNKFRAENNMPTVERMEWITEPTLNRLKNSVYYALDVYFSDGESSVNASLLLLGRYGYTEVSYTGEPDYFRENKETILTHIVENYSFVEEKKYSNFTTGDKVAAAGIGGLLAASLGIKAFKAGGIAALLLILKKAWFIIFIPFVFAWGWIKRLFTRNN